VSHAFARGHAGGLEHNFAPAPSTDEPGLIGPLQLLRSGPVDLDEGTITLPLYEGRLAGGTGNDAVRRTNKGGAKLHALLLRAARFEVARRRASLPHLRGGEPDDIALEAADDALIAVLGKLDDFRGASRFSTWAYKFAILGRRSRG
jgi:hypothetical protein